MCFALNHSGTDTLPDWQASSWRADETYIRVGGRWCYLYRAITAGTQGEPMAALSRMARREHRQITVRDGDLIIFSSSMTP